MSWRTVIEINHDYLRNLESDPKHLQILLKMLRAHALANVVGDIGLPGIRVLGMRHHSEMLTLEVS